MFIKSGFFYRKLRGLLLRFLSLLENNNNLNFSTNGEERFINLASIYFSNLNKSQLEAFDIGANKGDYTQILIDKLSKYDLDIKVHMFEPTKSCHKILKNRFDNISNIILNEVAVSNSQDAVKIYYDKNGSELASLYQRNKSATGVSLDISETVNTIRLDTYITANNITHIDLVKIDIEGHEIKAFEGFGEFLCSDFIDFIQFEYGGCNLDSKTSLLDLYSLLEARGFVIGKIMPKGVELRNYKPWMENFQYSNYVAISKKLTKILAQK